MLLLLLAAQAAFAQPGLLRLGSLELPPGATATLRANELCTDDGRCTNVTLA